VIQRATVVALHNLNLRNDLIQPWTKVKFYRGRKECS
jgi:hypothetical protein